MKFKDINPHIRFAEQFQRSFSGSFVQVGDCRLFYIIAGNGTIEIDNQIYQLSENCLFFCRENIIYRLSSENLTLISLNFDLNQSNSDIVEAFSPRDISLTEFPSVPFRENIDECDFMNSYFYIENAEKYFDKICNILSEFNIRQIFFRETCNGLLKNLLTEIARNYNIVDDKTSTAVSVAIQYIKKNLNDDISNKKIANVVGYHKYHLNRLFLKITGQSIHQYVLTERISAAKKMLYSDMLLSDIAEQCGFNSLTHFSAYFKQIVGMSPTKYRLRFKNTI